MIKKYASKHNGDVVDNSQYHHDGCRSEADYQELTHDKSRDAEGDDKSRKYGVFNGVLSEYINIVR